MRAATGVILILIVLAAVGVVAYKVLLPRLTESEQRATSDARTQVERIRIAGDNYLGYWFISAPEMRKQAARAGLELNYTDDGGAYAERLQKFDSKEYDCIVLPVNSYLQHGMRYRYPGVIVASISESKGADGIVGFADRLPTGKVNDLNDPNLTFVFTGASPSEFLLDLTITGFGLDRMQARGNWVSEVSSSQEVYQRAKDQQGDIFVLWEPDLSKALELPGVRYVWGSDNFAGYIVDVFVFHRDFIKKKQDVVLSFLRTYYRVMGHYRNNQEQMVRDMKKTSGLKEQAIRLMLEKIEWHDLHENATLQFGIAQNVGDQAREGLVDTIIACTDVLLRAKRVDTDPLSGDPYRVINSSLIEELMRTTSAMALPSRGADVTFIPLDQNGWQRLREVGTMRVEPITFQTGRDLLDGAGKAVVDQIALMLKNNYPTFRVVVRGHTGPGADEAANVVLSESRAKVVWQYLKAVHAMEPNRMWAEGVGSSQPPPKKPGESPREYLYRRPRVEFILYEANPL